MGSDQNGNVCLVSKDSFNKIKFQGLKNLIEKPELYRSQFYRYDNPIGSPFMPLMIESMEEFEKMKFKVLDLLYSRNQQTIIANKYFGTITETMQNKLQALVMSEETSLKVKICFSDDLQKGLELVLPQI